MHGGYFAAARSVGCFSSSALAPPPSPPHPGLPSAPVCPAQRPTRRRAGRPGQGLRRAAGRVPDEGRAIEEMGLKPRLVTGSRENLKVTFPEDLALAEACLASRR